MKIEFTEAQKIGAYCINTIKTNQPKCPECGSGVLHPKCMFEQPDCPRHEVAGQIDQMIRAIEKRCKLDRQDVRYYWASLMPLIDQYGPLTLNECRTLEKITRTGEVKEYTNSVNSEDTGTGYRVVVPEIIDRWRPLVARRALTLSCQGIETYYNLRPRGLKYLYDSLAYHDKWGIN